MTARELQLYAELAPWFHLLTGPDEYADEAALYLRLIREAVPNARTLLELGAGGGNNASHLKRELRCTLTDVSAEMLAVSRELNPECEHVQGDMRRLRLGRTFDAVLLHDAVMYMTTEPDLSAALATAAAHLAPGGVVVVAPDCTRETLEPGTGHGGHDGPDGRALRYLEWETDPDPADTTFVVDYVLLLRSPDGVVRSHHERHVLGVFPEATWLALLDTVGCAASAVRARRGDEDGREDVVFVGVRRGS